jgi:hypothetical protein
VFMNRGRLVQDKVTKKPRLNCRNWECGVVIPLLVSEEPPSIYKMDPDLPSGLEIFGRKIPVPMQGPARPIQASTASNPWFNDG